MALNRRDEVLVLKLLAGSDIGMPADPRLDHPAGSMAMKLVCITFVAFLT